MMDEEKAKVWAFVGLIAFVFLLFIMLGQCSGGSSSSDNSRICSSCDKKFTNSADTKSIRNTSMCERCYGNFTWAQAAKEAATTYQERYGN